MGRRLHALQKETALLPWRLRLTLPLLLAAGLNSACSAAEPPQADGQKIFQLRCSRCHAAPRLATDIRKTPAAEREAMLSKWLERHYPPPQAERAALVAYLVKIAAP
jgi:hypothetical protein